MSKGLEALDKLAQTCCNYLDQDESAICKGLNHKQTCSSCGECKMFQWEMIIEKELKALEIIKEKGVNLYILKICDSVEEYNKLCNIALPLTQEEYDLLKEVLL